MVKRVFYIEKEKFLRSMVELALKAKKAEIYTVDTLSENFYLIDDLKPQLVLFDMDATPQDLEKLYMYHDRLKLIATGPIDLMSTLDPRVSGFIPKPIVAHNLAERILSLID